MPAHTSLLATHHSMRRDGYRESNEPGRGRMDERRFARTVAVGVLIEFGYSEYGNACSTSVNLFREELIFAMSAQLLERETLSWL